MKNKSPDLLRSDYDELSENKDILESSQLYRGIFWIKDIDRIYDSGLYFRIPCDKNGLTEYEIPSEVSAKNAPDYNHKKLWESLPKKITAGKPFDFYPRGRIEIRNTKAFVYHSPHIPQDVLKKWVAEKFNLTESNGIRKIRLIADGSNHYRCWLD
ncbi:MAG: hypothetical protein NC177_11190 [Ruminococcus flavefaciens]|nr:hypothetical protein [Ruminococcus flavefaciens]